MAKKSFRMLKFVISTAREENEGEEEELQYMSVVGSTLYTGN